MFQGKKHYLLWLVTIATGGLPTIIHAQDLSAPGAVAREQQSQNQRQQALQQTLAPDAADIRLLNKDPQPAFITYPAESPCFPVEQLTLSGEQYFPDIDFQAYRDSTAGQCLGSTNINLLMSTLQNHLIDAGLVTSRVLAPAQDISSGQLVLQLLPGIVRNKKTDGRINLSTALPASEGELLDLRDIEQGLENLQRLPTVTADIQIAPGADPGESDLVVNWQQEKTWRVAVSADDAGSDSTGRNQGQITLFADNPLGLSDLFYVSLGSDVQSNNAFGTRSYTGHYSLPLGYWTLGFTASGYHYDQTVAGLNENIEYAGSSKSRSLDISRIIQRSAKSKTTISAGLTSRRSRNYIQDVEVEVQRRKNTYWTLGLNHRQYIDAATLDAAVTYRKGVRWLGADPAPEESTNSGTALPTIITPEFNLQLPFEFAAQRFRYQAKLTGQWTDSPLTAQDKFSIAGRYTVRGFDGQSSLAADKGWYLRNDIGWQIPSTNHELYLGVDYGEVRGRGSEFLLGKHLAGTVVGARGNIHGVGYELFAGSALSKPGGFRTDSTTYGFNLNWEF